MDFLYIIFWITLLYCSYKLKNDFVLLARMAFGITSDNAKTAGVSDRSEIEKTESSDANSDIVSFNRWRRILNCGWLIVAAIIAIPLIFSFNSRSSFSSEFIGNLSSFFKYERQISEIIMFLLGNIAVFSPIIAVCLLGSLTRRAIKKAFDVWQAVGSQRNELYQFGFPSDNRLKRTFYNSILIVGLIFIAIIAFLIGAFSLYHLGNLNGWNYQSKYLLYYEGLFPAIAIKSMMAWFLVCLVCKGLWQFRAVEMKNALIQSKMTTIDSSIIKTDRFESAKNILLACFLLLLFCNPVYTPFFEIVTRFLSSHGSIKINNIIYGYIGLPITFFQLLILSLQILFGFAILKYLFQTLFKSDSKRKGEPLSTFFMVFTVLWGLFNVLGMYNDRYTPEPMGVGYAFLSLFVFNIIYAIIGLICVRLQVVSQKPRKILNALAIALALLVIALPF